MKLPRRTFLHLAAGAAALPALSQSTSAQTYPTRPITMIVPFPTGGGTTTLARVLAEHMTQTLGQPVVVENVGGAGGSIGVSRSARAAPDGYSLSFGNWASHVGAGAVYPVAYDILTDFEPVARVADTPLWIVARKNLPAKDLKELIAWLKANPEKASAAQGHRRHAQWSDREGVGRSNRAAAICRSGPGSAPARPADAGGAWRLSEG